MNRTAVRVSQIAFGLLAVACASCQSQRRPLVAIDALHLQKTVKVSSRAFRNGGVIPLRYSNYGDNVSPDLAWSKIPKETQSIILLVQDPDTPQGLYTHWILYNISPTARSLPANLPTRRGKIAQGDQGQNDAGSLGYFGPRPPDAPFHHYHFQIFALNARLRPRPGYDTSLVYAAIHDHSIAAGELVGLFKKP